MTERELFDAALALDDPTERNAFLDRQCGSDTAMRQHVARLLDCVPRLGDFLDQPATPAEPTEPLDRPGEFLGPYKLLQAVGEGGCGVVYMAEQSRPMRRKVAVKVIKAGMDSREVIARFEAERQALAVMDHPNIARVLDAGTTAAGRPYFVMDLVRGTTITQYCDDNRLTVPERLRLLVPVCHALQHAHQKGIIHRDIKPSNVMVTLTDAGPIPKVIDFGVAKAIDHRLTERTMFTRLGQLIGTLEYMSPEQAELGGLDVDTRSDVYSLGVLLYELLTGSTPLGQHAIANMAFDEMLRTIRECEPVAPSQRVPQQGNEADEIAAARGADPRRLAATLRGELDWVVLKALETSRARRYASASELAYDLERFLAGDPVTAVPPSWSYRISKVARRHLGLISGVVFLLMVLLIAAPVSIFQAHRAMQAQITAQLERDQARHARDEANRLRIVEAKSREELAFAYSQLTASQAKTQEAHARAVRNEARLAAEKGHTLAKQAHTAEALLWLAHALEVAPADDEALRAGIIEQMAALWDDLPQPLEVTLGPSKSLEPPQRMFGRPPELAHYSSPMSRREPTLFATYTDPTQRRLLRMRLDGRGYLLSKFSTVEASQREPRPEAVLVERTCDAPNYLIMPSGAHGPFSPDGSVIAFLEFDERESSRSKATDRSEVLVHRLHADSGEPLHAPLPLRLEGSLSRGIRVTVGPRGEYLLVLMADARTGQMKTTCYELRPEGVVAREWKLEGAPTSLAIAPHGMTYATLTNQSAPWPSIIQLGTTRSTSAKSATFRVPGGLAQIAFTEGGDQFWVSSPQVRVRWSVPRERLKQVLPHGAAIQLLARGQRDDELLVMSGRQVVRWNLTTGTPQTTDVVLPGSAAGTLLPASLVAFSGNGQVLAAADGATVRLWDLSTGRPFPRSIDAPTTVMRLELDAAGTRLLCVCARDETKGSTHLFDLTSGAEVRTPINTLCVFRMTDQPGISQGAAALAPDGRSLLASDRLARLRRWNSEMPEPERDTIDVSSGSLSDAQFSADGRFVVTCTHQRTLEVWDYATKQRHGQPLHFAQPVRAFALSPNGHVMATASEQQVQFWFLATGHPIGSSIQVNNPTSLGFSRDGDTLFVGDEQGCVWQWHAFHHPDIAQLSVGAIEARTGLRRNEQGIVEPLELETWASRQSYLSHPSARTPHSVTTTSRSATAFASALLNATTGEPTAAWTGAIDTLAGQSDGAALLLLRAQARLAANAPEQAQTDVALAFQQVSEPQRALLRAWLQNLAHSAMHAEQEEQVRWWLARHDESLAVAGTHDGPRNPWGIFNTTEWRLAKNDREGAARCLAALTDAGSLTPSQLRYLGELHYRLGNWRRAADCITQVVSTQGGCDALWQMRANCYAELGEWKQAAADLSQAVQRHPLDSQLRERLGIALVSTGDQAGYQRLCTEALTQFDLVDYQRRPWTAPALFVLAPDGLASYQAIIQPALDFASNYTGDCVSYHVLGPYCYRAGQFEQAARATPPAGSTAAVRAAELLFIAMAHARLGNRMIAAEKLREFESLRWQDADVWERQRLQLLVDEVRPLIESPTP